MHKYDTLGSYRTLRKKACHSYWEQRILAQVGFLLRLLYGESRDSDELLEEAVLLLETEYNNAGAVTDQAAQRAESLLMPLSRRAKEYTVICAAHAHIDMNWMWGYQETVTVTLDTVRTMLTLMEEYPEFTFSQSQASVYHIIEEYAPELLEEIRKRIREGRWEVTASTWVENDKNMSGSEAMARHSLYTKKYLSGLLGIPEEWMNLDFEPDTFGHSRSMPEILKNGGIKYYYHCRGYEGHNIYRWRGISGAEVLVYREPDWYNSAIDSDMCDIVPEFCRQNHVKEILKVYGVGDHGGGPTRRDIGRLLDMGGWPLYPIVRLGTFQEFFQQLEKYRDILPVVDNELNYVFTGCYTSQSRIKMANHIGEARLGEAEALETMAALKDAGFVCFPGMEAAWRRILFNQFHDILPGSGTIETREYAMGEFQKAMAAAGAAASRAMNAVCGCGSAGRKETGDTRAIAGSAEPGDMLEKAETTETAAEAVKSGGPSGWDGDTAMGAGSGSGRNEGDSCGFTQYEAGSGITRYMALFNTTQLFREDPAKITLWDWQGETELLQVCDAEGNILRAQILETGTAYWGHIYLKLLVWARIPPFGYTFVRIAQKKEERLTVPRNAEPRVDHITDEDICLENDKLCAVFEAHTMRCISLVKKSDGSQLITPRKPACGFLLVTEETGNAMTAWREGRTARRVELNEVCPVIPTGDCLRGLRQWISYRISFGESVLDVKISLDEGSDMLGFQVRAVWREFGGAVQGVPQLRFDLPCAYPVKNYRYAIPFGMTDRGPLAQDVPAAGLGCGVPGGGGCGLTLMSDCKYGFRGDKQGLSLSLIRGSYDPDPCPETGVHHINFAVAVCETDEITLSLRLEQYLHPMIPCSCRDMPDGLNSFLQLEGGVLTAMKRAEDGHGFLVRIYNPSPETRTISLRLPGRKIQAYLCGFTERIWEQLEVREEETVLHALAGGGICSIRVVPG